MSGMLDPADVTRALAAAALDPHLIEGVPVMIVARRRAAVLWANDAAAALIGTRELGRASHLLFRAGVAACAFAARLERLDSGPQDRLERLRLGGHWTGLPQLIACRAVADHVAPEPLAILRWMSPISEGVRPEQTPAIDGALAPASGEAREAERVHVPVGPERAPRGRLLWTTDRLGVITEVDADFARLTGRSALAAGDHLPSRLQTIDSALAEQVGRILVHGGALAKSRLAWPRDGESPLSLEMGCARRRGPEGGLGGFFLVEGGVPMLAIPETGAGDQPPASLAADSLPVEAEASGDLPGAFEPMMPRAKASERPRPELLDGLADYGDSLAGGSARHGSNVVHFPAMRIASVAANFGVEMRSAPAVPTRRAGEDRETDTLETPLWAEAPEVDPGARHLSADEQDAFRQIGEVLGTKPSPTRQPAPNEGASAPGKDVAAGMGVLAPLLDALPFGLVWQIDGRTGSNAAFRARAGLPGDDLPDDVIPTDPGPDVTLTGGGGRQLAARTHILDIEGRPARLFVLSDAVTGSQDHTRLMERPAALLPPSAVEASATRDGAALTIAADGHALLADDGTLTFASAGAARLFGYDPGEMNGRPLLDFASAETREEWQGLLSVEGAETVTRDLVGRSRLGHLLPLTARIGRIAANAFFIAWTDNAQRQRALTGLDAARREAERTSALKSDFLAKVSHEIRTPLNAILGFAEIVRDERLGPVGHSRYLDYMKDIHASGTHVMSLVNDLLDLSRIEAGRMDLRLEAVDANAIINACVNSLQTQAHRERIIMRLSLAPSLPAALADERSLRQIVLNLLSNAIKFNEPGGQVIVSTAMIEPHKLAIRIRDTGIGMTDDEIETAMEPFRQVSTVKRTGSGLGLPVTKALVEANCASMAIRSTPGQGTLVEVTFPVVEHNSISLPAE